MYETNFLVYDFRISGIIVFKKRRKAAKLSG